MYSIKLDVDEKIYDKVMFFLENISKEPNELVLKFLSSLDEKDFQNLDLTIINPFLPKL